MAKNNHVDKDCLLSAETVVVKNDAWLVQSLDKKLQKTGGQTEAYGNLGERNGAVFEENSTL